jgi:hypothetical protein
VHQTFIGRFLLIHFRTENCMRMRWLVLSGAATFAAVLAVAAPASAATAGHGGGGGGGGAVSITVSPGSLTFGPQQVGTESAAQTVTITNTGRESESIYVSYASAGGTSGGNDFNLDSGIPCDEPDVLTPGASCTEPLTFAPITTGTLDATMNVAVGSFNGSPVASASLTGTAFDGPPASDLSISPASLTFAPQFVFTGPSAPQTVTLTNNASQPMFINDVYGFDVDTDCDSVTLAPGASCTAAVAFEADSPGPVLGSLNVSVGSYPDETTTSIPVSGEGLGQIVSGVTLSASTVTSGGTVTATILMGSGDSCAANAVNANTTVDLTPLNSAITVPAQVVVPEGQCSVSFPVTANQVSAATVSGFSAIDNNELDPAGVNLIPVTITVEP